MSYIGIVKRVVPFVLTFAAGLFIASFFVSLSLPAFPKGECRKHRHREVRQMRFEMESLKQENERIRRELELRDAGLSQLELPPAVPEAWDAPMPPPPPPRVRRAVN